MFYRAAARSYCHSSRCKNSLAHLQEDSLGESEPERLPGVSVKLHVDCVRGKARRTVPFSQPEKKKKRERYGEENE